MKNVYKSVITGAVALIVAGCGGGGNDTSTGGDNPAPTAQSLQLSGTAAIGAALANSSVEVKCATGSGSATTNANGTYSLTITGAVLPCLIQVTGSADGTSVTLHSVTEAGAGTTAGATTSAVANVTPMTEMIVAQLVGAIPADLFATFGADSLANVTQANLATATTTILTALNTATGIDFGAIDPFKATLVAATESAPNQGNAYDQLLDDLKEKVPAEALPLIINQIATASSTTGGTPPITLADVMAGIDGGSLPGCPSAISGKFRTIDYWGRTLVRQIDFKTMKFNDANGQPLFDITADSQKPCEFTATGISNGAQRQIDVAMGTSGAGAYRSQNLSNGGSVIGYIFPVQSHPVSAIAGGWTYLQSGYLPHDGVGHFFGKVTFNSNNSVYFCDCNPGNNWACEGDIETDQVVARADGGFDVIADGDVNDSVPMYAYRAPNGSLTIFGTTNPQGISVDNTKEQTSFVAVKLQPSTLPAVGFVTKYQDIGLTRVNSVNSTSFGSPGQLDVIAVDSANGSFTRLRLSDNRQDTIRINNPLTGLRLRPAGSWNGQSFPEIIQMPLPGLGLVASVNSPPSTQSLHLYNITVVR